MRDAVPFALKTYESLLASLPNHRGLLLATCSGFTQYSYAFVQSEADRLEPTDYAQSLVHRARALKLYLRGRDYCLRALEIAAPGTVARLNRSPNQALARFRKPDVPLCTGPPPPGVPRPRWRSINPRSWATCQRCAASWIARSHWTKDSVVAPSTRC